MVRRLVLLLVVLLVLVCPLRAQLVSQGNEQTITYSGSTAPILNNQPVNPNLLATTGTNTFLMNVNPNNLARLYITNDTANACANITVSAASTASGANSFNQNVNAWQTVQVANATGALVNSVAVTIPASGTITLTTAAILGNRIAFFVVLSAGCATTNVDMIAIFGSIPQLQQNSLTAGIDPSTAGSPIRPINVVPPGSGFASAMTGVPVGGVDATPSYNSSVLRLPGSLADGVLATGLWVQSPGASLIDPVAHSNNVTGCTTGTTNCNGLFVSDTGMWFTTSGAVTTGNNPINISKPPNATANVAYSVFETCNFSILVTNNAGAAPTLDSFVQDSGNGVVWNDRIHFAQISGAGTGGNQSAGIAGSSANQTVVAYTDGTIAASTIVSGPFQPYLRWKHVVGGAGSNYTVVSNAYCK